MKQRLIALLLTLILLLSSACDGTLVVGVEGTAGPFTLEIGVQRTTTPVSVATPTPAPVQADTGYAVLLADGFDGGDTSRWRSTWIAAEEGGNWYWRGTSGSLAQPVVPIIQSTYRFRAEVRLWNGTAELHYRQEHQGEHGYQLTVSPDRLHLGRIGVETFALVAEEPVSIGTGRWHTVEISGTLGHIQVFVDGERRIDRHDPDPWYAGSIGLSVGGGTAAYADFDNVQVLVPARDEPGWEQTSGPVGGIVNTIETDPHQPNILYAGGIGGGVFKTTDGGDTWFMLPPIVPPSESIRDILVPPEEAQLVYALAGRLYKSTDGGETWRILAPEHAFRCVAMTPGNPMFLIAATWEGRVYHSPNGGEVWMDVTGNLPQVPIVRAPSDGERGAGIADVAITTGDEFWAGTANGNDGRLYRTANGGASWNEVSFGKPPNTDIASIFVDPQDARTLYISLVNVRDEGGGPDESYLFRTEDGGATWTPLFLPTRPGSVRIMGQSPNGSRLYVANGLDVYQSHDGGRNWTKITPPGPNGDMYDIAVNPHDDNVLYLPRRSYGIFKSADGGRSWTLVYQGLHNVAISLLAVPDVPGSETVYAASGGVGTFKTTDRGNSWAHLDEGGIAHPWASELAVSPHDPRIVWEVSDAAAAFETTDGGESWHSIINASGEGFRFGSVYALAPAPSDPNTLYALKNGFGIFKSADGGQRWHFLQQSEVDYTCSIAVHPTNPDVVYSGYNPKPFQDWAMVRQSTDGGFSWQTALSVSHASGVTSVVIDPNAPDTVYAGSVGENSAVWVSRDAGRSWDRLGLPTTSLRSVQLAVDPVDSQTIYACAYPGGVFKSTDGGRTWSARNTNLPDVQVDDPSRQGAYALAIAPSNPDVLYLGLYGIGVYRSTDGADTWRPTRGLEDRPITALLVDPASPDLVYAAAEDGVYRTTDGGAHWIEFGTGLSCTDIRVLARGSDGTLYAGSRGYELYTYDKPDATWRQMNAFGNWSEPWSTWGNRPLYQHTSLLFHPTEPDTVYAGTFPAGVFKSVDGGRSWRERNVRRPLANDVEAAAGDVGWGNVGVFCLTFHPENPDVVYAGTYNGVNRSTDGGDRWEQWGQGWPARQWVLAITFDPRDPRVMYACSKSGDPVGPGREGVHGTVMKSIDGGRSWFPITKGLNVNQGFYQIIVDPHAPDTLYLATQREGVFISRDGGDLWLSWNERLTNPMAGTAGSNIGNSLVMSADRSTLYFGSAGSGVFQREVVR